MSENANNAQVSILAATSRNMDQARNYSSIVGDDFATKVRILKAVNGSTPIGDHLNKQFNLRNIVAQQGEMANEATGELESVVRVVLLDDKDIALHAMSKGITLAVRNVIELLGEPATWPEAVPVVFKQEGSGTRKYYTINLV